MNAETVTSLRVARSILADVAEQGIKVIRSDRTGVMLGLGQPRELRSFVGQGETLDYAKKLFWAPDGTWTYFYLSSGMPTKGENVWVPIVPQRRAEDEGKPPAEQAGSDRGGVMALYTIGGSSNRANTVTLTLVNTRMNPAGAPKQLTMDTKEFQTKVSQPTYWKSKTITPEAMKKILGYDPLNPDNSMQSPAKNRTDHGMKNFFERALQLVKKLHGDAVAAPKQQRENAPDPESRVQKYMKTQLLYTRLQGSMDAYEEFTSFLNGFDGDPRTTRRLQSYIEKKKGLLQNEMQHVEKQKAEQQETVQQKHGSAKSLTRTRIASAMNRLAAAVAPKSSKTKRNR